MHNLIIPLVTCVIAFAAIFGYQAFSDSQLDERIELAVATSLDGESPGALQVELTTMQEINKGYGICGEYSLSAPGGNDGVFFYSKVSERVSLGADDRRYQANCGDR